MFWVLAPVALVGVVAVIAAAVSDNEKEVRRRWQSKYAEVERTVEEHRKNIEQHVDAAQTSYDFAFLVDLHFSSMRVADSAYSLLEDARSSITSMSKILDQVSQKKTALKAGMATAPRAEKATMLQEIRSLNEFKSSVLQDLAKVKQQREVLYTEVKRLNLQTGRLKEAVRDRCGTKGREWYARLEQRKAARRAAANA